MLFKRWKVALAANLEKACIPFGHKPICSEQNNPSKRSFHTCLPGNNHSHGRKHQLHQNGAVCSADYKLLWEKIKDLCHWATCVKLTRHTLNGKVSHDEVLQANASCYIDERYIMTQVVNWNCAIRNQTLWSAYFIHKKVSKNFS